jgi:hypothetical protein
MTKKKILKKDSRKVNVDGIMTYGKLDNNLNQASFAPCEHVEVPPFIGRFKVQRMNNGYLYLVELAKRIRNSPLFRLAHSSFSFGRGCSSPSGGAVCGGVCCSLSAGVPSGAGSGCVCSFCSGCGAGSGRAFLPAQAASVSASTSASNRLSHRFIFASLRCAFRAEFF